MKKLLVVTLVLVMAGFAFGQEEMMKEEAKAMETMSVPTGAPAVWFEIGAANVEVAREFYMKMFGFEMEPSADMENYYTFSFMGEDIGGLFKYEHPYVSVYFAVDCVSESLKKAVELGGEIVVEETPLTETSQFGVFKDPEGNFIGLWAGDMGKDATGEMMDEDDDTGDMEMEESEEMETD